jgi:hypothetical protein
MSEALGFFGVLCAVALIFAALYAASSLGTIARSSVHIAEAQLRVAEALEALRALQSRKEPEALEKKQQQEGLAEKRRQQLEDTDEMRRHTESAAAGYLADRKDHGRPRRE